MKELPRCKHARPLYFWQNTKLSSMSMGGSNPSPVHMAGFWGIAGVECMIFKAIEDGEISPSIPQMSCDCPDMCLARVEGEPWKGELVYLPALNKEEVYGYKPPQMTASQYIGKNDWAFEAEFRAARVKVIHRDGGRCRECGYDGTEGSRKIHVHHIVPRSEGGSNDLENLLTLCEDCHREIHRNRAASDCNQEG